MELTGKTILILSPQSWGKMFVSKHHYALELAKRGNTVYFLNPPVHIGEGNAGFDIVKSDLQEGLFLINHRLFFPYRLKFHALPAFHFLMQFHIRMLLKRIASPVDMVWSFDLGNLYPFRFFPRKATKIFHPVDEPLALPAIRSAEGAHYIFSVTTEILEKYQQYNVPKTFINHGATPEFLGKNIDSYKPGNPLKVGFSGNLLRNDIDRKTLLSIINHNSQVEFHFWGSYAMNEANMGGNEDSETRNFINDLKHCVNVRLYGAVPPSQLAASMQNMDAFLICYDIEKDQSKGTNYHKVMEFISSGKVVVSNNITTYQRFEGLIEMSPERRNNDTLPDLFRNVIQRIEEFNSVNRQKYRVQFALDNTYSKQLDRICEILNSNAV